MGKDFLSKFSKVVVVPVYGFNFEFSTSVDGEFKYADEQYELWVEVIPKKGAIMQSRETARTLNGKVKAFKVYGDIPGRLIQSTGWLKCE